MRPHQLYRQRLDETGQNAPWGGDGPATGGHLIGLVLIVLGALMILIGFGPFPGGLVPGCLTLGFGLALRTLTTILNTLYDIRALLAERNVHDLARPSSRTLPPPMSGDETVADGPPLKRVKYDPQQTSHRT